MIHCIDLGTIPFRDAWSLQDRLRTQRANGDIPDTLLLCEHPPTFTMGRQDCRDDWQATFDTIRAAGIDVVQINRGGRITYHGPGQLVGYCIFDLKQRAIGIRPFVRAIEEVLIRTVAAFQVIATRDAINPGIWVGTDKLGAIGLHVSRHITQHGFALNRATRLADYQYIIPCGIRDRGVTSLERLLADAAPQRATVCHAIQKQMGIVFQDSVVVSPAEKVSSSPSVSAVGSS